jgi:hypothetical protein
MCLSKYSKSSILNMSHRLCTDDPVWYIFIIVDDSLVKSSWSLSQLQCSFRVNVAWVTSSSLYELPIGGTPLLMQGKICKVLT